MAWRINKPKKEIEIPEQEEVMEPYNEDIDEEIANIKNKLNEMEKKKVEPKQNPVKQVQQEKSTDQISKQELIDIIEGNLARVNSLVELLRRI